MEKASREVSKRRRVTSSYDNEHEKCSLEERSRCPEVESYVTNNMDHTSCDEVSNKHLILKWCDLRRA